MTEPASGGEPGGGPHPPPNPIEALAGRLRLALLIGLAVSAIGLLTQRRPGEEPPPDIDFVVAIGLAFASILTRAVAGSPRLDAPARGWMWIASLACAAGIGVLAWIVTLRLDAPTTALLYTLASAIFALRRPLVVPSR